MPTSNGHNLYFIRILQAAFQEQDRPRALKSALEEIVALGNTPEYREGFENFQNFLKVLEDEVVSDADLRDDVAAEALEAKLLDIATNSLEGTDEDKQLLRQFIEENPELRSGVKAMLRILGTRPSGNPLVEVEVEKEGLSFGLYRLEPGMDRIVIPGIQEGQYTVRLSTGWLIWEGRLLAKQVLWHLANPGARLPAAAETQIIRQKSEMTSEVLAGAAILELFPGLESGTLLLTFKRVHGV